MKSWGRRAFLTGIGGATVGLPILEGLLPRKIHAKDLTPPPYLIIFRKGSGVQQKMNVEPERFWPKELGPLTSDSVAGRAVDELDGYLDRLLMVKNVNTLFWGYGDGHANGCLQSLTNRGPLIGGKAGASEASGESIDSVIARELNPPGNDSLFLYSGDPQGFVGGACLSHLGPGVRRSPISNATLAYHVMMGLEGDAAKLRQRSVNDVVREQMKRLMSSPKLSSNDVKRLDMHFESIRDLETSFTCPTNPSELELIEMGAEGHDSTDGDVFLEAVRAQCRVAAMAVACGYTRVVVIQMGSGNNASVFYRDPDSGEYMENYHFVSHRKNDHDVTMGEPIPGADLMHHVHDRIHFGPYRFLLDLLDAQETVVGPLLDAGVTAFFSDVGTGPNHGPLNLPWILAGSAGGFFKQGQFLEVEGGDPEVLTNSKMIHSLGSAVGLRNADGGMFDDFGDTSVVPTGLLPEILV